MANEIKDKFASSTALTITIASLANAAGRQSTLVDNTTNRYQDLLLFVNIKTANSPNANSIVEIYLIRTDNELIGTQHNDDGAGTSDAALAPLNAQLIGALRSSASPGTGEVLKGSFLVSRPGPEWGVALFNRTGQTLDSTGSNHWARYIGLNPEVQ
jgi:hypothetical protein